jgi:arylsulfatase A-like enzyme
MKKQNIIWFIADQMRSQAMSCNGDPNVITPNFDNMAIEGSNFQNAVSGYPLCCPFRASMLTGKYAHNHSVKIHEDRLEPSFQTITDVFNDNDYETIYLGKWHLAGIKEREQRSVMQTVPKEDRGRFDTWIGYDNNNSQWDTYLHGHDGETEIPHYRLPDYETNALMDLALERIAMRKENDRPFFMVISVQPPHNPHIAPADSRKYQAQQLTLRPNVPNDSIAKNRIALSGYYSQIDNLDKNLGRLNEGLRSSELLDDTHIVFFSDHGEQLGSQGRGGKCVPFEESIRIPFMIGGGRPLCYDGQVSGTRPCLVNHVDIAPTTLGLCDIDAPEWMEGYDYSHHRTGKGFKEKRAQDPKSAYIQLIGNRESSYAWRCVVTADGWKYACVKNGEWIMYNLNIDPYEQNNLAFNTSFYNKREELKKMLNDWITKTGDEFLLPDN